MHLHEVENPILKVVKYSDLNCMEEVGLEEVTHSTGTMSKHFESSLNMGPGEFGINCLRVGIAEHSI